LVPALGDNLRQFEQIVRDHTNVRFREDLLKYLGPTWCIYRARSNPVDAKPGAKSDPTAFVLLAAVKDAAAFVKVLDAIASFINENAGFLKPDQSSFLEKLPAPALGYTLTRRAATMLGLGDGALPTIMVGRSYIAVAATPCLAREALASENQVDCS
jgi:hypothetical protein